MTSFNNSVTVFLDFTGNVPLSLSYDHNRVTQKRKESYNVLCFV